MKNLGKIVVGVFSCPEEIIDAIKRNNDIWHDKSTLSMMDKLTFNVCEREQEVELFLVSVSEDLGFTEQTTFKDVIRKAETIGLHECPAETGPTIVLKHSEIAKNIPLNTLVAMGTLFGQNFRNDVRKFVFEISQDRLDQRIITEWAQIRPDEEMIFMKAKSITLLK